MARRVQRACVRPNACVRHLAHARTFRLSAVRLSICLSVRRTRTRPRAAMRPAAQLQRGSVTAGRLGRIGRHGP